MTNNDKILKDLRVSQSTADSIAGRLGLHRDVVAAICDKLTAAGTLVKFPLHDHPNIIVYRILTVS